MEGVTWGVIAAVLALCCSLCSVASFYFGRRKAATDEAKEDGSLSTDLAYIKDNLRDTSKSLNSLSIKLDEQNKQREQDYRDLLIKFTKLEARHDSLNSTVRSLEAEVARYHHS